MTMKPRDERRPLRSDAKYSASIVQMSHALPRDEWSSKSRHRRDDRPSLSLEATGGSEHG